MKLRTSPFGTATAGFMVLLATSLWLAAPDAAVALQSDRQQPMEVNAATTDGTFGDGITMLRGNVDIRQGSLYIRANEAEVLKRDGKVQQVVLRGTPALLEQEIEQQGMVQAEAVTITYRVSDGLVVLKGDANVQHPQYAINGDELTYDLNAQHFQGTGTEDPDGRIFIRLEPEVAPDLSPVEEAKPEPETASDSSPDGEDA